MASSLVYLAEVYAWLRKYVLSLQPGQKIDLLPAARLIHEASLQEDKNWQVYFSTLEEGLRGLDGRRATESDILALRRIAFGLYRQYAALTIVGELAPSEVDKLAGFLPTATDVLEKIKAGQALEEDELDDAKVLEKFGLVVFKEGTPRLTDKGSLALGLASIRGEAE